jgi:hypothetical protein
MGKDLTVIFLTNNKVPEKWAEYHKEVLLDAIGDYPLISISRKPMDLGINIIQTEAPSSSNIYWQLLKGVKLATTPYIAVAEDDTLYTKEHFSSFRPDNAFAYNDHRWSIYTWGEPAYSLKNWISTNAVLIAPTKLLIESLEERFAKYPHDMPNIPPGMCGELGSYEKQLAVTPRKKVIFKTLDPVVQFDHDYFTGSDTKPNLIERRHHKIMGTIRAYDIPVWGRSIDLVKKFI